jgi:hypothetical protein
MPYPQWSYFPRNVRPPTWAVAFVEVVEKVEDRISTVAEKTGLSSDAVLGELRPGLIALGYVVESGDLAVAVRCGRVLPVTESILYVVDVAAD